ncbi:hypothetical protein FGIG_03310 [Fasciola gigantica]|uniref:PH domain-containing protein n=1 Tax=Fasciola gigantica TaxID=46835 RepID=A0A504YKZ6_FASGI|nr:hypothetical protein FGIG_03310 [Fasciola gigantica]
MAAFRRLKGSQRLWHVFDENTLSLVAYKTEEEANSPNKEPLKSINISQAAFYIDPNEINQFVITVDGKDHVLQSETEEAMYLWLGALQSCRNEALTTGLISAVQEEVSNTNDRKKLPKLQLGKLTTPMLRSTNAPSFDLNEVFSSSPGQIRKDWRLGLGTSQQMPQMGSPLPNRPSTPINGMNRNSPELNRCPVNHDPTAKYRSKSSPCESEAEVESRDSDQLLLRDETDDNVDSYSLNREPFFGQHAPLLVSTTTPISDKMKFYSLSQRQLYNAPTFSRRGLTQQTFAGSVDMSGFSGSDAPETSVTDETGSTLQIVSNFTESFDDKYSPKLYNPTPPPDSTMTTSMCTSNVSTRRASRASDHNTIPLLNSTDETMPYYQHEPYLNKLR